MSEKNLITNGTKELLLARLLENSQKHRIKTIAERYGLTLSDKLTKQQMIEAVIPAIEVNFGLKLKRYTSDDLSVLMECFTGQGISEQSADRIMSSLPFLDGAVYIFKEKDDSYKRKSKSNDSYTCFYTAVPHELAGKIQMSCVTKCFDNSSDLLLKCTKACSVIYGRFTAKMLADCVVNAFSIDMDEQKAYAFLSSSDNQTVIFQDEEAVTRLPVSLAIPSDFSSLDYYLPSRMEIESYAAYGANTSDYYYRQIVNLLYSHSQIPYDTAEKLIQDISVWCADNQSFKSMVEKTERYALPLSTETYNYLLGMIGDLNAHSRKPCLKGHRPDEVDGFKLPEIPRITIAPPKNDPVKVKNKIGRNDPCPCGSGKKYKKCCGRN